MPTTAVELVEIAMAANAAPPRCDTHPEATALAPCSRCGRPFCDPCLTAMVEGLCACEGCADTERGRAGRPWGFAAVVLVVCATASFAFARAEIRATGEPSWALYGLAFLIAIAFAGFIVSRKRGGLRVVPRQPGEGGLNGPGEEARGAGGPYRQAFFRAGPRRLPPVSGRLTAFALVLSFAFCALAAPFALHLPRWVEVEIVFAAGWLVWTGVLAALLYRGGRVADDHRFDPSNWFRREGPTSSGGARRGGGGGSGGGWFDGLQIGDIGGVDGEGCLVVLGALLLAGGAILTAWLLVELVIPALFTLTYLLLIRALKVATNDSTGCQGNVSASATRGVLYATLFMGPLLALAAAVHLVARRSGMF
jgi:hypothetical protein